MKSKVSYIPKRLRILANILPEGQESWQWPLKIIIALNKKHLVIKNATIVINLDILEEIIPISIKDKLTFKYVTTYSHNQDPIFCRSNISRYNLQSH